MAQVSFREPEAEAKGCLTVYLECGLVLLMLGLRIVVLSSTLEYMPP